MRAVVGRDRELEKIGSFLELEDEAADVLLIEGDAGIGKTTLWRVAVDEARERGYRVLSCAGAEAEAQLSFNAVRDLLGDAFAEVADELPAPQRRALSATLLLDEDEAGPPEPDAIAVGLLSALRLLAARERTIVAVDDVQWLDGASAAPLAYALRRLGPEPVAAVVSRRTEAERPDPLALDRLDGQRLDRLELRGLSLGAVGRILHQRLGTAYPRSTLRRVHEVSAGNPLFALELARALGDSARALLPGPALPLTGTLRQLVERRLAALRDDTLEVLVFAAALTRPTLAVLTDAVGRVARPELAPAVDAQVVVLEGDTLQYAHPLFAAGVYALAGRSRQVEVHRRLAGVVADVEERARHLALGTEGPDAEVALAVEAGARAAFARGAPGTAAELIADALRLTPPMPRERLVERQRALADYHLLARNLAEAANVLVELVDELPPGPARADARFKLARARQNDDIGVSRALAEAALADAGGTHATAAQIECYLSNLVFAQGEADLALSHAREAVSAAEQAGNDGLHAEALTVSTWLQTLVVEEVDPGVLDKALDLDDGAIRPIYANPSLVLGVRHMYSGRLDEARAQLESVGAKALAHGDEFTRSGALIHLTELECRAGNWRAAARHVEEVAAQHQAQSGLQWARGLVAALLGRVDEAHEALELGIASAADAGSEFFRLLNVCVLGFLELSVGDHAAADGLLRPAAERLTGWCREPSVFGELPNGIEALVELGELGEAERLLAELEGRLPRLKSPWARASAGRCRGMIISARGDHEGAFGAHEAALAVHERLPQPFDHARTLLALGAAQRRARQRRAARESLQVSLALFEQLGAKLWAEKARAELARIGGRARSSGELTAGERRIAELVAEGKTNKEVAAVLVIADRTVESALTQIYRKLGVRSRTELARKLAALG